MKISFRKIGYFKKRLTAKLTGRSCVHLIHISKTGGTAIKNALKDHLLTPSFMIFPEPHRITMRDIPNGHRIMFVTRDPVARFVSAFDSRQRQGLPSRFAPWREGEEIAFQLFPNANSLALALNPDHPEHANALKAMKSIRHLRHTYWDWFGDENALRKRWEDILFIGRIETFDADFRRLVDLLDLPQEIALPSDSKRANRSDSSEPLSPEAEIWVKQWFQKDYEFIELCAEWSQSHSD